MSVEVRKNANEASFDWRVVFLAEHPLLKPHVPFERSEQSFPFRAPLNPILYYIILYYIILYYKP